MVVAILTERWNNWKDIMLLEFIHITFHNPSIQILFSIFHLGLTIDNLALGSQIPIGYLSRNNYLESKTIQLSDNLFQVKKIKHNFVNYFSNKYLKLYILNIPVISSGKKCRKVILKKY
jgi:hypothetical protein